MMSWLQFAVLAPAIFILGMCASAFIVARAMRSGRLVFLDDVAFMRMQQRCVELKLAPGFFVRACVGMQLDAADQIRAQQAQAAEAPKSAEAKVAEPPPAPAEEVAAPAEVTTVQSESAKAASPATEAA